MTRHPHTCGHCDATGHDRRNCPHGRDETTSRQDKWRRRRIEAGLCGWCGRRPLKPTSAIRCADCLRRHHEGERQRRSERVVGL